MSPHLGRLPWSFTFLLPQLCRDSDLYLLQIEFMPSFLFLIWKAVFTYQIDRSVKKQSSCLNSSLFPSLVTNFWLGEWTKEWMDVDSIRCLVDSGEGRWHQQKSQGQERAWAMLDAGWTQPVCHRLPSEAWEEQASLSDVGPYNPELERDGPAQEMFSGTHVSRSPKASNFPCFSDSFFLLSYCLWEVTIYPSVGGPMFDVYPHCRCSWDHTETAQPGHQGCMQSFPKGAWGQLLLWRLARENAVPVRLNTLLSWVGVWPPEPSLHSPVS